MSHRPEERCCGPADDNAEDAQTNAVRKTKSAELSEHRRQGVVQLSKPPSCEALLQKATGQAVFPTEACLVPEFLLGSTSRARECNPRPPQYEWGSGSSPSPELAENRGHPPHSAVDWTPFWLESHAPLTQGTF